MNVMIAAVGIDPNYAASRGSADGALFVASFAAVGLVLLFVGGRVLKSFHEPHAVRYTGPRA